MVYRGLLWSLLFVAGCGGIRQSCAAPDPIAANRARPLFAERMATVPLARAEPPSTEVTWKASPLDCVLGYELLSETVQTQEGAPDIDGRAWSSYEMAPTGEAAMTLQMTGLRTGDGPIIEEGDSGRASVLGRIGLRTDGTRMFSVDQGNIHWIQGGVQAMFPTLPSSSTVGSTTRWPMETEASNESEANALGASNLPGIGD